MFNMLPLPFNNNIAKQWVVFISSLTNSLIHLPVYSVYFIQDSR